MDALPGRPASTLPLAAALAALLAAAPAGALALLGSPEPLDGGFAEPAWVPGAADIPDSNPWPGGKLRFRAQGPEALSTALDPSAAPSLPAGPTWVVFDGPTGSALRVYVEIGSTGRRPRPERASSLVSLLGVTPEILLESGPFDARGRDPLSRPRAGLEAPFVAPPVSGAPISGAPIAAEPVPEPTPAVLIGLGLVLLSMPGLRPSMGLRPASLGVRRRLR